MKDHLGNEYYLNADAVAGLGGGEQITPNPNETSFNTTETTQTTSANTGGSNRTSVGNIGGGNSVAGDNLGASVQDNQGTVVSPSDQRRAEQQQTQQVEEKEEKSMPVGFGFGGGGSATPPKKVMKTKKTKTPSKFKMFVSENSIPILITLGIGTLVVLYRLGDFKK